MEPRHPLRLDLAAQSAALHAHLGRVVVSKVQAGATELLQELSELLATPQYTLLIAKYFRPLLVDLTARWLSESNIPEEARFVALALLLECHEEIFPITLEFVQRPSLKNGPVAFVTPENATELSAHSLQPILLAYDRIVRACPFLPDQLGWSLHPLLYLVLGRHPHRGVVYLAIQCYALQSQMTELARDNLIRQHLGELGVEDCAIDYGVDQYGATVSIDGWLLNMTELSRVADERVDIAKSTLSFAPEITILREQLSPRVVDIEGIILLKDSAMTSPPSPMVMTRHLSAALQKVAAQYSLRFPTLLTSAPSSGKMLLLSHLALQLHPKMAAQTVAIYLADTSIDARSLLGSHVSSQTEPGKFEWKEGVLLRAMREGRWIVLKDIDRASVEVLGVLLPLIDSMGTGKYIGSRAYIDVPNRGRVHAHSSFAIFATRSVASAAAATFLGAHKFVEIVVSSPSLEDLAAIVDAKFPRLSGPPAVVLVRLWESIRALGPAAGTRPIGLRELDKWCSRVSSLLPTHWTSPAVQGNLAQLFAHPSLREDMFLEARDVFFGTSTATASAQARNNEIARIVADELELGPQRASWLLDTHTPQLDAERNSQGQTAALRIGRTRLPARLPPSVSGQLSSPFAMHRPALTVLSRVAAAVALTEPVLLTGETGTGKTTLISHIATQLGRRLVALNLSNQSEAADLIGGFKPVDARLPAGDLQEAFSSLFDRTFSRRKNEKFEEALSKAVREGKWKRAVTLWNEAVKLAKDRLATRLEDDDAPRKRRKLNDEPQATLAEWDQFERDVSTFNVQHILGKSKLAFSFVEGPLLRALRAGDWILLDEINLATPETLECVSALLQGPQASITLTEHGSLEPVHRHSDFRLFACMNPATDVGKKDLPPNIRGRFTEIFVPPPDADPETLTSIVRLHIGALAVGDKVAVDDVAEFYKAAKDLAEARELSDGSNQRPHYSMRTLTRMLSFVSQAAPSFGLRRALWEGGLMAFTTSLSEKSAQTIIALAEKLLLSRVKNIRSTLALVPNAPTHRPREDFVQVGPYWLERGPHEMQAVDEYIVTPSVAKKLVDLARVVYAQRFPVLIEGPTSSGKTSTIEYLARRTGHRFVRINNHEHTDIQEYIGSYLTDPTTGKLTFQDGILVRALRNGEWIVLDELNLAPTDVLEALNRLLDDNRELLIPETQEVVRPHPQFRLFATQNPPGLYAGRKVLSRAFRNRFLELFFDDVPEAELEEILSRRTRIAPSYATRIVSVFRELQKRRQTSRVFETKHGFATLRDLFRWAGRDASSPLELAQNGYMLLAERARRADDKQVVKEVIESTLKVKIDEAMLYGLTSATVVDMQTRLGGVALPTNSTRVVWTAAMQRLFVLVAAALRSNEPVLLVGETGCGKTSVCEIFAEATGRTLHTVSCHQNTETADIIGGQRPIRNRAGAAAAAADRAVDILRAHDVDLPAAIDTDNIIAALEHLSTRVEANTAIMGQILGARQDLLQAKALFRWHDGPLIDAMKSGSIMLLDEISLADDSVLERLNSVLEPERTIVMAEMGGRSLQEALVVADERFKLVATMNPGGDYGKKELSPALRNRFTEIWVPAVEDRRDREMIVSSLWQHTALQECTRPLLDFIDWLAHRCGDSSALGLRDILAWVRFSNHLYAQQSKLPMSVIFHNAANLCLLDGLDTIPLTAGFSAIAIQDLRTAITQRLYELYPLAAEDGAFDVADTTSAFRIGPFTIAKRGLTSDDPSFDITAPTTLSNAMRVLRALQVPKPILLEGSPGVGKTSLVVALAARTGNQLERINLSDQTDMVDLFGSDLPVEGGKPGEFAWKDAAFLRSLQEGHWVLLDEMNLAPQAVLEGLNAVLDHRGEVFIPEMGRSFNCHPNFRVFAAQNPQHQGGGRKGLPKSFLNRFTKVYLCELDHNDLLSICRRIHPELDSDALSAMIAYNTRLHAETMITRSFGRAGTPWEFNLRDVLRWTKLVTTPSPLTLVGDPAEHLDALYLRRFRSADDRHAAASLFTEVAKVSSPEDLNPWPTESPGVLNVGFATLQPSGQRFATPQPVTLLQGQLSAVSAFASSVDRSTLTILVGGDASGKTSLVRFLAEQSGKRLHEYSLHGSVDTMDILGSFEQSDLKSSLEAALKRAADHVALLAQSDVARYAAIDPILCARLRSPAVDNATALAEQILIHVPDLPANITFDLRTAVSRASQESAGPTFEWSDGTLVQAIKDGSWVFLDNANLCNASVLDRLNSLCEVGGSITLSERGLVDGVPVTLTPHRGFRLILGVNPRHGELSRAMRNRGLEIFVDVERNHEDLTRLQGMSRLPATANATTSVCTSAVNFELVRRGLLADASVSPQVGWLPDAVARRRLDLQTALPFHVASSTVAAVTRFVMLLGQTSISDWHMSLRALDRWSVNDATTSTALKAIIADLRTDENAFRQWLDQVFSALAQTRGVPLHFLRAQPVVFSFNPIISRAIPESAPDIALALYTRGFFFTRRIRAWQPPPSRANSAQAALHHLVHRLSEVLLAVPTLLDAFWLHHAGRQHIEFASILDLLDLSCHLLNLASHPVVDVSAVRVVVLRLASLVQENDIFLELTSVVSNLTSTLSLTTGECLNEIWQLGLRSQSNSLAPAVADHLVSRFATGTMAIRKESLELLAAGALHIAPDVVAQSAHIGSTPCAAAKETENVKPAGNDELLALELGLLAASNSLPATRRMLVDSLLWLTVQSGTRTALDIIPMQLLKWQLEVKPDDDTNPELGFWQNRAWLRATWESSPHSGPSALLAPVMTQRSMALTSYHGRPIVEISAYKADIGAHAAAVSSLALVPQHGRAGQLLASLLSTLIRVHDACAIEADRHALMDIRNQLEQARRAALDGIWPGSALQAYISAASHLQRASVSQAVTLHLAPLASYPPSHLSGKNSALGNAFIAIARFTIQLYLPNVPLDPLASLAANKSIADEASAQLQAQLDDASAIEHLTTGNQSSPLIDAIRQRLTDVEAHRVQEPPVRREVDPSVLSRFHGELTNFVAQILDQTKLETLASELNHGTETAQSRCQSTLSTLAAFVRRLSATYPQYSDLIAPFALSMDLFATGIALLSHATCSAGALRPMEHLCALPTLAAVATPPSQATAHADSSMQVELHALAFTGFAFEKSVGVSPRLLAMRVDTTASQLCAAWILDRELEKEHQEAQQSIIRQKFDDNQADEEERDFLALFPDFSSGEDASLPSGQPAGKISSVTGLRVKEKHISMAYEAHLQLWTEGGNVTRHRYAQLAFENLRVGLAKASDAGDHLDGKSWAAQLASLRSTMDGFASHSTTAYNFYLDANIPQIQKAHAVLSCLDSRLSSLIASWPDQMVLQDIRSRCRSVHALELNSSVAQVLTGLEALLMHCSDWERYANRENSIQTEQSALTSLIVEWRRLELTFWSKLLDIETSHCESGTQVWWFRLYELVVRGTLASIADGAVDEYITSTVQLLDSYITTAPVGQFSTRLRLVASFGGFANSLAESKSAPEATALRRLSTVIELLRLLYSRFQPVVREAIASARGKIERDVVDFIKLASWKDVNVQALKQSAQKTHRQLHKCIRKFREALRQPFAALNAVQPIPQAFASDLASYHSPVGPTHVPELSSSNTFGHLNNLQTTLQRLDSLLAGSVLPGLRKSYFQPVSDLAADVQRLVKDLSSERVELKNRKAAKALLQRKQRAWSDILKELRRSGIPTRSKHSDLEKQRRREWLLEQPVFDPTLANSVISNNVASIDSFYVTLIESMSTLRAVIVGHHADIPTRELERAISVVEVCFTFGISGRASLVKASSGFSQLIRTLSRLRAICSSQTIAVAGLPALSAVYAAHHACCRAADALDEILTAVKDFDACRMEQPAMNVEVHRVVDEQLLLISALRDQLGALVQQCGASSVPILLTDELRIVTSTRPTLEVASAALQLAQEQEPRSMLLCSPVIEYIATQISTLSDPTLAPRPVDARQTSESVISTILVAFQELQSFTTTPSSFGDDEHDSPDNLVAAGARFLRTTQQALHVDAVLSRVDAALEDLAHTDGLTQATLVQRALPFLDRFIGLIHDHVVESAHWTRSMLKLTHILCTTVTTVGTNGWCQPQEEDPNAKGDDATGGQQLEGTGLGSGTGEKNVSNEITEESQVEGLQDETEDEEQPDGKDSGDQENTIEMSEDFGGRMEDAHEKEDEEDDDEGDEEEQDVDDRAEDLDPTDPNAVDEKMWGGEDDSPDAKDSDDRTQKGMDTKNEETELGAKQEKQETSSKEQPKEQEQNEQQNGEGEEGDEQLDTKEDAEDRPDDEPAGAGGKMDEYTQEGDALELPDDLDLGGDDKGDDVEDGMSLDDDDDASGEEGQDADGHADEPPTEDDVDPSAIADQQMPDDHDMPDAEAQETTATQPDISAGDDVGDTDATAAGGSSRSQPSEKPVTEQKMESAEKAAETADGDTQATSAETGQPPEAQSKDESRGKQGSSTALNDENATPTTAPLPNPMRHLGDAVKEIQRRLQEILQPTDEQSGDMPQDQSAKDVEYLQNADEAMDMQALGPAEESETAKLDELKFSGADEPPATRLADDDVHMMDVDDDATHQRPPSPRPESSNIRQEDRARAHAVIQDVSRDQAHPMNEDSTMAMEQLDADERIDADDLQQQSAEAEQALRDWKQSDHRAEDSEQLWRQYEGLTHHLAYALCEQLRLILEPTRASRLRGDYRTGKRLNMKKIIPFIASEYTKDKIWLRRTRPSDREYQILLALDDSRSMAESHSVHLAFQTLALVGRALTRLEAGDVGVARFGQGVDMLHGFDDGPFTEHAGARVIRDFTFAQTETNVARLVESSLKILGDAREKRSMQSSTSSELWQLEIIISDGMCQSHDQLRVLLRRALEQRIMVVFIVIDALRTSGSSGRDNSILTMQQVVETGVGDFEMRRYLDSFPFQYYVVLRDVEALPEVLSGTLRQFFERVTEE